MTDAAPEILVLTKPIDPVVLRRLVTGGFGDMVKFVVDVQRGVVAVGGELHADAEQLLLQAGSRQQDLWGANYYPGRGREGCLEFTALINISPARGNRSMEVSNPTIREQIRTLAFRFIGDGGAL